MGDPLFSYNRFSSHIPFTRNASGPHIVCVSELFAFDTSPSDNLIFPLLSLSEGPSKGDPELKKRPGVDFFRIDIWAQTN
jgi:hypothetical protein